jgi:hypothetical protein
MSNVKFVDIDKTIDSQDLNKAFKLLDFHKYLQSKSYWTIGRQILFVKKITKRVKEAIRNENLPEMSFCSAVLEIHWIGGMLDLERLKKAKFNPLTHFIFDCEQTLVHKSPLARKYIDFLFDIGDIQINKQVMEDIGDVNFF